MRCEWPGGTAHTHPAGRRRLPCPRDLPPLENKNPSPSVGKRAALVTRSDQVTNLDLLPVLPLRQLADRLYARARKGIPPCRSQVPF